MLHRVDKTNKNILGDEHIGNNNKLFDFFFWNLNKNISKTANQPKIHPNLKPIWFMKISWAFLEGSFVKFLNENLDLGLVSPALHGRWWLSGNILAYSYYRFPDGRSRATAGTSTTKNSSSYLVLTKTSFTLAFETLYIYIYIYIYI